MRETRSQTPRETGTQEDVAAPAPAPNPVGLMPCFWGRSPSLLSLLLQLQDPTGNLGLTRCRRGAQGSPSWDREPCPGTGTVSRPCPLPTDELGTPGPGISLCQGSCSSPCPWESLLVRSCP